MTPKQQGFELVERFKNLKVPLFKGSPLETYMGYEMAKQCALITIDEIIKNTDMDNTIEFRQYFNEMKKEIELL